MAQARKDQSVYRYPGMLPVLTENFKCSRMISFDVYTLSGELFLYLLGFLHDLERICTRIYILIVYMYRGGRTKNDGIIGTGDYLFLSHSRNQMLLTNYFVNAETGIYDPRHMYICTFLSG